MVENEKIGGAEAEMKNRGRWGRKKGSGPGTQKKFRDGGLVGPLSLPLIGLRISALEVFLHSTNCFS